VRARGGQAADRGAGALGRLRHYAFYAMRVPVPCTSEVLLVLSAPGKGIVMRPEGLRSATRKAAAGKKRGRGVFGTRLASGEKPCRKRMAALACVYDAAPAPRRPHDRSTSSSTSCTYWSTCGLPPGASTPG